MVSSLLVISRVPGRSIIRRAHDAATVAIIVAIFGGAAVGVAALAAACGLRRRLVSCCLVLVWPCSSWACRRPWTIGLRAAGTASSGGEALRVLGSHAALGCPGLEWP